MYPSFNKDLVFKAIRDFYNLVMSRSRVRKVVGMWFAISKHNRKLDRIGKGASSNFVNFHWSFGENFLKFELFHNNLVVQGPWVLQQHSGVPIGGTCSTQLACAYCVMQEFLACKEGNFGKGVGLLANPVRFRDNIIGCFLSDESGQQVKQLFESVYQLPLQIESIGNNISTLEVQLAIHFGQLQLRWKPKGVDQMVAEEYRIKPLVDPSSPNARSVVRSAAQGFALKALHYALTSEDVAANLGSLYSLLSPFPSTWWHSLSRKVQSGCLTILPGSGWQLHGVSFPES
jgi:hypothetical protein